MTEMYHDGNTSIKSKEIDPVIESNRNSSSYYSTDTKIQSFNELNDINKTYNVINLNELRTDLKENVMEIKTNEVNDYTYAEHFNNYNKDCDKVLNEIESSFPSLNIQSDTCSTLNDTTFNKDSDDSFDTDYKTCNSESGCEEDCDIFLSPKCENTSCDNKSSVFTNSLASRADVSIMNSPSKNQNIKEYKFLCDVCGDLIEMTNFFETSGTMKSKQHENKTLKTLNTKDIVSIESAAVSNKIKCPECGDSVEVLKSDFEFLIEVHYQKHSACREVIERINKFENSVLYHSKNHEAACIPVITKDVSKMADDNIKHCLECGDRIEVLNNDFEFSMQLHSRKHQDVSYNSVTVGTSPSIIKDNVDYICPECDETVTIFNKDIELSFTRHHQEYHKDRVTGQERTAALNMLVPSVFKLVPAHLQKDQPFIVMEENSMHCKVCNCSIKTSMNMFNTALSLNQHLSLDYHKEQALLVAHTYAQSNITNKPKINISKPLKNQSKTCSVDSQTILKSASQDKFSEINTIENIKSYNTIPNFDITGNILVDNKHTLSNSSIFDQLPENLNVHKDFFQLINQKMYCSLCLVDVNQTEVKNHIIDISHRLKFFAALKEQLEDCKRSQVKYLIFLNGQLYCNICKYNLIPWNDFDGICQVVKRHFENIAHRLGNPHLKH